jgi:hypothetical protein
MARKKKSHKKTHRRHHRVSGLKVHPAIMSTLEAAAGAAVGAGAAVFLNNAVKTAFPTGPTWTGGAIGIAVGVGIPVLMKATPPVVTGFALGLAGMSAVFIANETFINMPGISGIPGASAPPMLMKPGYVTSAVAGMKKPGVGNMSGNQKLVVAGILDN